MSDFDQAIAVVLRHEGGYQCDPDDRGNWTGGACGVGDMRGTKFGISAAAYPNENIRDLTEEQARRIYYLNYWFKGPGLLNDQALATKVLDLMVNMERTGSRGPAVEILQRAICACGGLVEVDGCLGQETASAANALDAAALLERVKEAAVEHYCDLVAKNPKLGKWLAGWEARAKS